MVAPGSGGSNTGMRGHNPCLFEDEGTLFSHLIIK